MPEHVSDHASGSQTINALRSALIQFALLLASVYLPAFLS